ncbi:MAG: alpha/beta hydrolase, partial [Chloroflexota bacterium]|nr:alpha/beta hydrolase [Chloroflexota bacterium]
FTDLLHDFIKEVIGKLTVVVAHGLTSAYVIADAYRRPQLFERLILVSPPPAILEEKNAGPLNGALKALLRTPVLGQFVYNILASRPAIRGYYDNEGYHNPGLITDDLVEYVYTSAHQPNSRYAAASVISNALNMDVHEAFARLQMPVVVIIGREGPTNPTEASAGFTHANKNAEVRILDKSMQNPQEEQSNTFNNFVREFAGTAVKQ